MPQNVAPRPGSGKTRLLDLIPQKHFLKLFGPGRGEVWRNWSFKGHCLAGCGMAEREFMRVQHLARKISGAFAAVNFVAEHGMTKVMKVDANLMGSTCVKFAFDKADEIRTCGSTSLRKDPILGFRGATAAAGHVHLFSIHRVPRDRRLDDAASFRRRPGYQREIDFARRPLGKLSGQIAMTRIVLRHDERAARFFIETMHDAGAFLAADPR